MYTTGTGTAAFCAKECKEYDRRDGKPKLENGRGPGAYNIRHAFSEMLNDKYHRFKGKFTKTPRTKMAGFREAYNNPLWPEDKGLPGPATYDPYETEEWTG